MTPHISSLFARIITKIEQCGVRGRKGEGQNSKFKEGR